MATVPRAQEPPEPNLPADAPAWMHAYAEEVRQYLEFLKARTLAVETRIDNASIPE